MSNYIVPHRLVSECNALGKYVQGLRIAMHKTYSPLDDQWVILLTSKASNYFRAGQDEIRRAFDSP